MWRWVPPVLAVVLLVLGLFLILLVLIQRGKGGGLAGAFGGAGGSSAFGSRAGDTFTKITIYVAAGWILLIMILIKTTQPTARVPVKPSGPSNAGARRNPLAESAAADHRRQRAVIALSWIGDRQEEVDVLCSMTGYGDASYQSDDLQIAIEMRAVNNRYLKVCCAPPSRTTCWKPSSRRSSAARVRRGALQIHLRCQRKSPPRTSRSTPSRCEVTSNRCRPCAEQMSLADGGAGVAVAGADACPASCPSRPSAASHGRGMAGDRARAGTGPRPPPGHAAGRRPSDGPGTVADTATRSARNWSRSASGRRR